jgi:hypothetical protein|tara:strand:+ start:211 stop:795 length:585 start_codon:yes stop_codon:yes gene_type:complete
MTNTEIMIDIETLGISHNSIILTIGVVKFTRDTLKENIKKLDSFYRRIDIKSCLNAGLTQDKSTREWWERQNNEVKYEALENPNNRVPIEQALQELSDWIKPSKFIWANSPEFDCVILDNAYKNCNLKTPWSFWNTRDCRTLYDIANVNKKDLPNDNSHNALCDCYQQIYGVLLSLEKISMETLISSKDLLLDN